MSSKYPSAKNSDQRSVSPASTARWNVAGTSPNLSNPRSNRPQQKGGGIRARVDDDDVDQLFAIRSNRQNNRITPGIYESSLPKSPPASKLKPTPLGGVTDGSDGGRGIYGFRRSGRNGLEDDSPDVDGIPIGVGTGSPSGNVGSGFHRVRATSENSGDPRPAVRYQTEPYNHNRHDIEFKPSATCNGIPNSWNLPSNFSTNGNNANPHPHTVPGQVKEEEWGYITNQGHGGPRNHSNPMLASPKSILNSHPLPNQHPATRKPSIDPQPPRPIIHARTEGAPLAAPRSSSSSPPIPSRYRTDHSHVLAVQQSTPGNTRNSNERPGDRSRNYLRKSNMLVDVRMTDLDLDDAQGIAKELLSLAEVAHPDKARMQSVMQFCKTKQHDVKKALEDDESANLSKLCASFDSLSYAIDAATKRMGGLDLTLNDSVTSTPDTVRSLTNYASQEKPSNQMPPPLYGQSSNSESTITAQSIQPELSSKIQGLVNNQDTFALIMMLTAPPEQSLDSALALMRFARDAERHRNLMHLRLRNEIRSAGGISALLLLFRTKDITRELRVVSSLAVAYLLPSLSECASKSPPMLSLRIVECLRFLFSSLPVSPRSEVISRFEMCNASVMGLTTFLELFPILQRSDCGFEVFDFRRARPRQPGAYDQRPEALEWQKLLEITVELIVTMAKISEKDIQEHVPAKSKLSSRYTLVELICAFDATRPLAVREGIIQVLVEWVKSTDHEQVRLAALCIRDLTSTLDKYMAGWIHSQMVNDGALGAIVTLVERTTYGHDVRLAVAQILSSLCTASQTRDAVVDAQCIKCLISLLMCDDSWDPSSQEVAFAAGSALLELAAGGMARSGFSDNDFSIGLSDVFSRDKRDQVINEVVNLGAISIIVKMARSVERGKLRSMSIETLRVLSEDISPRRSTRLQLCEHKAAEALGKVLQDDVLEYVKNGQEFKLTRLSDATADILHELYHALCALANILDPTEPIPGELDQKYHSGVQEASEVLIQGCTQITESLGLKSLLMIASVPITIESLAACPEDIDAIDLLLEACRSLAALSPLLLSGEAAKSGYTAWTRQLLHVFTEILFKLSATGEVMPQVGNDLMNDCLRGLSALAQCEPLKIRIVDRLMPYLMKAKAEIGRSDRDKVANAAQQVCLSLGFAEDELAVQVARNDENLLCDWFCLRRSFLVQAMAREEIRIVLALVWQEAIAEAKKNGKLPAALEREGSGHSSSSSKDCMSSNIIGESGINDFFENVGNDADSSLLRASVLEQYGNFLECGGAAQRNHIIPALFTDDDSETDQPGLLCRQVYPLSSSKEENDWILAHHRALKEGSSWIMNKFGDIGGSRVHKLLDSCIPSRLLQREILPVFDIRPEASFNFRALSMPQRKYFSFRLEGQLVQRLCEEQADESKIDDVHWTLGFTNSSFAGEFSETLVQAMYRCPMIRGLSFVRTSDKESEPDEDSGQLARLAGSLPPCVSDLTFDNVLNDHSGDALISILKAISLLSAGQHKTDATVGEKSDKDAVSQKQGSFRLLAIRNSSHLKPKFMSKLFSLLDGTRVAGSIPSAGPLSSLLCLDLSGNDLDDWICSEILKTVHSRESRCRLEHLDLSRNRIRDGKEVTDVFRKYVARYRFNESAGVRMTKSWVSPLRSLHIASNQLFDGTLARELIAMMKNDALSLQSLDLSFNKLNVESYEFTAVMCGTLSNNSRLRELNLSGNNFDSGTIDSLVDLLGSLISGLTFLRFDSNTPPLTDAQRQKLNLFERRSRNIALEKFLLKKEQIPSAMTAIDHMIPQRHASVRTYGDDDMFSLFSEDSLPPSTGQDDITVLFASPLIYFDETRRICPFGKLDFAMERDLLWACLKEASMDISLSFDSATKNRLLAAKAKRPSCLHYSGHGHASGHQAYLLLENENESGNAENYAGGPQWLEVGVLQEMITREGGAPFKFVFVSACFSLLAGETFASAGVRHVVCCEEKSELKDAAALAFTKQFYLSLAVGNTVKESFDQGRSAVRAAANIRDAELETEKFVLLPRDGDHDVPVFNARKIPEWPKPKANTKAMRERGLSRSRSFVLGGARSFELSVRNMMQDNPSPTPPQFFLGREVDMFHVLGAILTKRLVIVTGKSGVGRSSLVCAICHYINERKSTIIEVERIFHVRMKAEVRGGDRCRLLLKELYDKLVEAGKAKRLPEMDQRGVEDLSKLISNELITSKALIVFDHTELLENNDEERSFPKFLATLFEGTRFVRVLLTDHKTLGIPSIGGVVEYQYPLRGLSFGNSVRLFAKVCSHLHTGAEREAFFQRLCSNEVQEELIAGDPECTERTNRLFEIIGHGMPADVERIASSVSVEVVMNLGRGDGNDQHGAI